MNSKIKIETYSKEYKQECIDIIKAQWPLTGSGLIDKSNEEGLVKLDFEIKLLKSNYQKVVLINNRVSGLLFSSIASQNNFISLWITNLKVLIKLVMFLLGFYGLKKNKVFLLKEFIKQERELSPYISSKDNEVTIFVMSKETRGKGLGRMMVDQLLDKIKEQRGLSIKLYTNEDCTWQFYEKYGFKRIFSFPHRLHEIFSGTKLMGFVYEFPQPCNL